MRKHQRMIVRVIRRPRRPAGKLPALLEGGIALAEQRRFRYAHFFQGARMVGHVPSPTPMILMSGDSTSVTEKLPALIRA